MMIEITKKHEMGLRNRSWLQACHHFSFGDYYDPKRMGFGALRVWNDDEIAPNSGFPTHPHDSMEILTYVRSGAITHEDTLGNKGRTIAGDIQVMSAGDGISHSEVNLESTPTTLFQIWFEPRSKGGTPWWKSNVFPDDNHGEFKVVATGFEHEKSLEDAIWMNADANLKAGAFKAGESTLIAADDALFRYIVVDFGDIRVDDHSIPQGNVTKGSITQGDSVMIPPGSTATLYFNQDSNLVMAETLAS